MNQKDVNELLERPGLCAHTDLAACVAERDRARADLEAWARAIPAECCVVTEKDQSVAADCAAEWRRRYDDLKRQLTEALAQRDALAAQLDEAMEALEEITANGCEGCAAVAAAVLKEKP